MANFGCVRAALAAIVLFFAVAGASAAEPQKLSAKWLGVATIVLDDGETAIMTDGFFSRPGLGELMNTAFAPNEARIDEVLAKAGVKKLAAIAVAHSHHDHAMDAPIVAAKTGAVIVGSNSTANIARGAEFPEDRIRVVTGGEEMTFGRFKLKVVKSPHSPAPVNPGEIAEPLHQPARIRDYKEGGNFSFAVTHDGRTIVIIASANFTPGFLNGVKADVVFLGIGALGKQSDEFAKNYWHETVATIGAKRVIPIHWDNFFEPLDKPMTPLPAPADDFDRGMKLVTAFAAADHVTVTLPVAFETIDLSAAP